MIIVNGTIQVKTKTGGGLDTQGNPVRPTESWGDPIDCHIRVNSRSNLGKSNGNSFTTASYVILIEPQPFVNDAIVRIAYKKGSELGEFPIMFPPEYLEAVEAIRIVI